MNGPRAQFYWAKMCFQQVYLISFTGVSSNLNRRTRLLLKILALSDVALYRTRAERLHNDMFVFLKDASNVYCEHFSSELEVKHAVFNHMGSFTYYVIS